MIQKYTTQDGGVKIWQRFQILCNVSVLKRIYWYSIGVTCPNYYCWVARRILRWIYRGRF